MRILPGRKVRVAGIPMHRDAVRIVSATSVVGRCSANVPPALRAVTAVAAPLAKRDDAFEWPTFSEGESTVRSHLTSKSGVSATALQDLRRFGRLTKAAHWFVIAALLLFGFYIPTLRAQGNLAPPGPPGATMLTLSQVQPRIPVDSVHTPGNSATEFLITTPGSYYLTTNIIGVSSEYGIEITASDVTLDLNGFSMTGPPTANSGIIVFSGTTNAVIRNGIINGWSSLNEDIFSEGNNITIENMSVSGAGTGIACLGFGGVIRNCTASLNGEYGIYLGGPGYLIYGNTCFGDNTVNEANGSAMLINGSNNRIENNFVTGSGPAGFGIAINTGNTNNVIVRNSVQGNWPNDYLVNFQQLTGPVITNTVSGMVTNSNPWANFGF